MNFINAGFAKEEVIAVAALDDFSDAVILAAIDHVIAIAAVEEVGHVSTMRAAATVNQVVAVATIDVIATAVTDQDVVAGAAVERVVAVTTVDIVIEGRAYEHFMRRCAIAGVSIEVQLRISWARVIDIVARHCREMNAIRVVEFARYAINMVQNEAVLCDGSTAIRIDTKAKVSRK